VGSLNRYGWWKRQDGAIRQQLIKHLTRQIMHYDGEFRREEATSAVGSSSKHWRRFGSTGAKDQFDPGGHAGQAGGSLGGARDPFKNTEDPKIGA
jgi:hypothetical protein